MNNDDSPKFFCNFLVFTFFILFSLCLCSIGIAGGKKAKKVTPVEKSGSHADCPSKPATVPTPSLVQDLEKIKSHAETSGCKKVKTALVKQLTELQKEIQTFKTESKKYLDDTDDGHSNKYELSRHFMTSVCRDQNGNSATQRVSHFGFVCSYVNFEQTSFTKPYELTNYQILFNLDQPIKSDDNPTHTHCRIAQLRNSTSEAPLDRSQICDLLRQFSQFNRVQLLDYNDQVTKKGGKSTSKGINCLETEEGILNTYKEDSNFKDHSKIGKAVKEYSNIVPHILDMAAVLSEKLTVQNIGNIDFGRISAAISQLHSVRNPEFVGALPALPQSFKDILTKGDLVGGLSARYAQACQ